MQVPLERVAVVVKRYKENDFNPEPLRIIAEEVWKKNAEYKQRQLIGYYEKIKDTREFCFQNGLEHIFLGK
jgi:hypothetical protein